MKVVIIQAQILLYDRALKYKDGMKTEDMPPRRGELRVKRVKGMLKIYRWTGEKYRWKRKGAYNIKQIK